MFSEEQQKKISEMSGGKGFAFLTQGQKEIIRGGSLSTISSANLTPAPQLNIPPEPQPTNRKHLIR